LARFIWFVDFCYDDPISTLSCILLTLELVLRYYDSLHHIVTDTSPSATAVSTTVRLSCSMQCESPLCIANRPSCAHGDNNNDDSSHSSDASNDAMMMDDDTDPTTLIDSHRACHMIHNMITTNPLSLVSVISCISGKWHDDRPMPNNVYCECMYTPSRVIIDRSHLFTFSY
jgi:hypothetical protein